MPALQRADPLLYPVPSELNQVPLQVFPGSIDTRNSQLLAAPTEYLGVVFHASL